MLNETLNIEIDHIYELTDREIEILNTPIESLKEYNSNYWQENNSYPYFHYTDERIKNRNI